MRDTISRTIKKGVKMLSVIRKEGGSKILTITKFLPKEWRAVEIAVIKASHESVTLKINKVQ